jgi:RNA polymerase sigma factor (sigma-70 family)
MEVSSFRHPALPGRSPSAGLLRLASDERLIALTRRGHERAFEAIVQRYRARLLAFCRHMLGSREDAEDILQEVFVAAFNAIVADERPINVRPWLYRIARNRCLNQLRRATATGVDSMDIFLADNGQSVSERILQREQFRSLLADISSLPESQRTALLLREIDALPYEQIAEVMDTTIPSVKSLLVRARVALAEAAEARALSCEEVREQLGEEAEGLTKLGAPVRRHLRSCPRCRAFRKQLKHNERVLGAVLPVGFFALAQRLVLGHLSSTTAGGAGGAYASGGAGAAGGAVAGATASAGGIAGIGSFASLGGGAIATKAIAGLAAAAIITAGAVAAEHTIHSGPPQRPARSRQLATSGSIAPAPLIAAPAHLHALAGATHNARSRAGHAAGTTIARHQTRASRSGCSTPQAHGPARTTVARAGACAQPAKGRAHAPVGADATSKQAAGAPKSAAPSATSTGSTTSATGSSSGSSSTSSSASSATSTNASTNTSVTSTGALHSVPAAGAHSSATAAGGETIEVITSTSELPAAGENGPENGHGPATETTRNAPAPAQAQDQPPVEGGEVNTSGGTPAPDPAQTLGAASAAE